MVELNPEGFGKLVEIQRLRTKSVRWLACPGEIGQRRARITMTAASADRTPAHAIDGPIGTSLFLTENLGFDGELEGCGGLRTG